MLQPLLEFYNQIAAKSDTFTGRQLSPNFFIDVFRSQPFEPELYEYFSLPAIFVDYTMEGQGKNQPRLVTMTLHVVTDATPSAANISDNMAEGVNKFMYNLTLQEILEGCTLGQTTPLKFMTEDSIDAPVTNYHSQTYQFEAFLQDMIGDAEAALAQFEQLNIFGSLRNK